MFSCLALESLILLIFAGLNQATWTFMFLAGLKESLEKIGYRHHITVKGDDVRMSLLIPNEELRTQGFVTVRKRILDEMQDKCKKLGWQLNPNESFVSLSIVCTSKQYVVKDAWLPCAAKKIMKCSAVANVVFPTLEDHISTIYSVAHSACSQSTVALPCYAVAVYLANRLLVREMTDYKLTTEQLIVMSLWPQVLGGPGPSPLQTFLVRGENDMLSCGLSLFRMLDKAVLPTFEENGISPGSIRSSLQSVLNQELEEEKNFRQLLLDPYAINLAHPPRPTTLLKKAILEALKEHCKHPDILDMLSAEAAAFDDALEENLVNIRPCCPKVISAIWECSPSYLVSELISKFLQSQTVVTFLMLQKSTRKFRGKQPTILRDMIEAQKTQKRYWARILTGDPPDTATLFGMSCPKWDDVNVCNTTITKELRDAVWGTPLYGITYPSLVDQVRVYDPRDPETHRITTAVSNGHIMKVAFKYKTAIPQVYTSTDHYSSDPSCKAWLGSKTDTRIMFPGWPEGLSTEPALRLHKLIMILAAEANLDVNVRSVLRQMMTTLISIHPDLINILKPAMRHGNFFHRIPTHHYSVITMPNCRPNLANMVSVDVKDCLVTQLTNDRKSINHAAVRYFTVAMATWPLQSRATVPEDYPDLLYAVHDFDLKEIEEDRFVLCKSCCSGMNDVPLKLASKYSNPMLYHSANYHFAYRKNSSTSF